MLLSKFRLGAGLAGAGLAAGGLVYCEASPNFDPEALERGAKALREINKSPYAKQANPRLPGSSCSRPFTVRDIFRFCEAAAEHACLLDYLIRSHAAQELSK